MFLAITDILNWVLPITLGLLVGYMIATRGKNQNKDSLVYLNAEDFRQNMRKGQLIDLRSKEDFEKERINGSRNFPKREILGSLFKLRADQPVFLYNETGTGTVKSVANKLAKKGFKPVYILKEGFQEWPFIKKSN
ncbi:MAG: rhodanese-like domain-containing protein [Tenericutes bacterium]|nr:rhodanese-like domain-containing protein [Mycoplasmatota bacterium]